MSESRRMRPLLGTFVEIGAEASSAQAQAAISEAFAAIEQVQRSLSFQDPASELSRLNASPGTWVAMSRSALQVLRLARAMADASAQRFNCTVGGQLVEWGLLPDHGCGRRLPVGHSGDIDLRADAARLVRPVLVTLDGIAKGYAVDRAIHVLQRNGLSCAWVNAGGDLRVYGPRHLNVLRRSSAGFEDLARLGNGAIASSRAGAQPDTERFPGRIVGACPSLPTDSVVSVAARRAWRADALTKVAVAMPASQRQRIVTQLGGALLRAGTC
ncbi:MAG: FAD:protein FMN transferase [Pseudomonadales bacterium]